MVFKRLWAASWRFLLIYALVNLLLVLDMIAYGPFTWENYTKRAVIIGISGIAVYFIASRFGGGHPDDAAFYAPGEEAEARRKIRRSWMFAAMFVSVVLLLTAAISQLFY